MKHLLTSTFFLLFAIVLFGQANRTQTAINEQVWIPFMKSYENFDTEGFMDVHTPDVIRINRDGKQIRVGQEYAQNQATNDKRSKKNGVRRSIEFRFLERLAKGDTAFEVGYYKIKINAEGQDRTFYGKFQVILKQRNGQWRIWVDSDTSHNQSITESQFRQGTAIQ